MSMKSIWLILVFAFFIIGNIIMGLGIYEFFNTPDIENTYSDLNFNSNIDTILEYRNNAQLKFIYGVFLIGVGFMIGLTKLFTFNR